MGKLMDYVSTFLGKILSYIDAGIFAMTSEHNVGICIILFTIVVYLIMIPLNAKQQKSARLMNRINPEIKAIQAKYSGKKDNESAMKMNAETQAVYAKYGVSPFGGCLPMLISLPIIWALYGTIRNIANYIDISGGANIFLGLDVMKTPKENASTTIFAYAIPVLAVVFQFINTQMIQMKNKSNDTNEKDSMAQSMKMMNYFMPLMSGFFTLTLSTGIGLYWITGSIFRIVQTFFINRHVDKISLEDLIEKNKDKASKKAKKREEMNEKMEMYSKQKTSSIKSASSYNNSSSKSDSTGSSTANSGKKAAKDLNVNTDFKEGSVSGYANMLSGKKDK